jgi:hypothetical protein
VEELLGDLTDGTHLPRPPKGKFKIPRFLKSVKLKYEQFVEASRLSDEWEDNMETKFAEPKA